MGSITDSGLNLSVLRGTVAAAPLRRDLPAGGVAVQFDVSIPDESGTHRVPVAWIDPPEREVALLTEGLEVVVVGRVRRRFFRAGGATQSRTEVLVSSVVLARRRAAVARALAGVTQRLEAP